MKNRDEKLWLLLFSFIFTMISFAHIIKGENLELILISFFMALMVSIACIIYLLEDFK